jgi:hypothetical protein
VSIDQDLIRLIGTLDNSSAKNKVAGNKWSAGLRKVIEQIRREGINDVGEITKRVVTYRRAFFGDSILEFDYLEEENTVRDADDDLSDGEVEE